MKIIHNEFRNILDCFTCVDGGISFINFKMFIEDMEKKCINTDKSAAEILNILVRFSKMIDIANNK